MSALSKKYLIKFFNFCSSLFFYWSHKERRIREKSGLYFVLYYVPPGVPSHLHLILLPRHYLLLPFLFLIFETFFLGKELFFNPVSNQSILTVFSKLNFQLKKKNFDILNRKIPKFSFWLLSSQINTKNWR